MKATVAITTTAERYERWSKPLHDHGFETVHLPCIEVRPSSRLAEARARTTVADWLMVTSPRTVGLVWPQGEMPQVPVAAAGEATASAVKAAGGILGVTGDDDADRLVELLSVRLPPGARVVIPHGERADTSRFERLAEEGAEIETMAVYATDSVAPGLEPVDGAVFASPSAVEGWSLSRSFDSLKPIGAIGHVTASALARHGVTSPVVPDRPDPGTLAAALSATMESTP